MELGLLGVLLGVLFLAGLRVEVEVMVEVGNGGHMVVLRVTTGVLVGMVSGEEGRCQSLNRVVTF